MMGGGGHLMWSSMYGPNKPGSGKRVDWKRIGALFLPYWKQLALVLLCIVLVQIIGLIPAYLSARIIDVAFPHRDYTLLAKLVGFIFGSALVAAAIGVA